MVSFIKSSAVQVINSVQYHSDQKAGAPLL